MAHDHGHSDRGHNHRVGDGRLGRMGVAIALLVAYLIVEVIVGVVAHSLALLADAGHMLTDVLALSMGITAVALGRFGSRTGRRTFGWHRTEVLTAILNAVLLFVVAGYIVYEAVQRLGDSSATIHAVPVIVTAVGGLAVNIAVMLLLRADAENSIAVRGAYLEVVADAVGSIGVIAAGLVTLTTGWRYADIVAAIAIAIWVVPRAVKLALAALRILAQNSPRHLDVNAIENEIHALAAVSDVHDLHIWSLTTGMDVATVHVASDGDPAVVLSDVRAILGKHGLDHATIQVEPVAMVTRCQHELSF